MTQKPVQPKSPSGPKRRYDGTGPASMKPKTRRSPKPPTWGREAIVAALNEAADNVLDWCGADDTGARDVVNLVVNAFGAYLDGSRPSINAVIADAYGAAEDDESPMSEQVYEWCNS